MAQGHVATILGNGWEVGAVTDPKTGNPKLAPKLSTFPLPGAAAGQYTPSFLGGSDLAVPAKAPNAALGAEWIKIFTDTTSQTALAKFAIPNTTSLLSVYEGEAQANQSTGEAAKSTWFVPNTPNWANVESGNILQNALESIATGKSSIGRGGRHGGLADREHAERGRLRSSVRPVEPAPVTTGAGSPSPSARGGSDERDERPARGSSRPAAACSGPLGRRSCRTC